MHSTIEEAIQIGLKMNACRTVLTHFSQRYTVSEGLQKKKKPLSTQEEAPLIKEYMSSCGLMAVDHMRFRLSQLSKLPILSPAINFGVSDDN